MQEVYSILVRWSSEWDGQSIVYTKSKSLFDALRRDYSKSPKFESFSNELKDALRGEYDRFYEGMNYIPQPIETIDLVSAIEWLECCVVYPVTVLDHTEFNPSWNW